MEKKSGKFPKSNNENALETRKRRMSVAAASGQCQSF